MKSWKGKNVLITGCSGIVGSWLSMELIEKGADVVGLMRDISQKSFLNLSGNLSKLKIVYGDIGDYSLLVRILNEHKIDACFHLAAQSIVSIANQSPLSTFNTNIMGTWNILEACRKTKTLKKIVIASSDRTYGEQEKLPYTEDMKLKGHSPYDVSKVCADILAQSYHKAFSLPVGISRCGNIYGPGDLNFSRIVPDTIRSLIFNRNPVIKSDGTYLREYIFVKDAVRAYILLAEGLDDPAIYGEAFNFGNGEPIRVLDLVNLIIKISGKTELRPKILMTSKGEIKAQYLSSAKSKKILGWKNEYNLKAGLKETYAWYEKLLLGRIKDEEFNLLANKE